MATTTTKLGLIKNADGEFGWQDAQRTNLDTIDTEATRVSASLDPQHNADGTHTGVTTDTLSIGGVARNTWPASGSATVALTDVLTNGGKGNIPAAGEFEILNNAGTVKHFGVDEATGKVTAINLAGMFGNIMSPLVHIPFKRQDDEVALSGAQTFTRASTGTYIDPLDGLVKTAAINTPRFERMADGGTGILLEGASTNLEIQSGAFATSHTTDAGITITPTQAAPDGSNTADLISPTNASNTQHVVYGTPLVTGGAGTFTHSIFVKASGGRYLDMWLYNATDGSDGARFDLLTGSVILTAGTVDSSAIKSLGNGWYRCSVTVTHTVASTTRTAISNGVGALGASWVGDGTSNLIIWGAQFESMPFSSSYIPTTTTAVTRAADSGVGISPSGNINNGSWTIIMDAEIAAGLANGNARLFGSLGSALRTFGGTGYGITYTSSTNVNFNLNSADYGTPHRYAFTYDDTAQTFYIHVDGVQVATRAASPFDASLMSSFAFGEWQSQIVNAVISDARIYDAALSPSEVASA